MSPQPSSRRSPRFCPATSSTSSSYCSPRGSPRPIAEDKDCGHNDSPRGQKRKATSPLREFLKKLCRLCVCFWFDFFVFMSATVSQLRERYVDESEYVSHDPLMKQA